MKYLKVIIEQFPEGKGNFPVIVVVKTDHDRDLLRTELDLNNKEETSAILCSIREHTIRYLKEEAKP